MKTSALLLLAALPAAAGTPEALRSAGSAAFSAAPSLFAPPPPAAQEPVLQPPPRVLPFSPSSGRPKDVARIPLASQLDRQRALLARQLGAAPYDVGAAADAGLHI